jgi:hypothetical protein
VLGTRLAPTAPAPEVSASGAPDGSESEAMVALTADERTVIPDDEELIIEVDDEGSEREIGESTEPCAPLFAEAAAPDLLASDTEAPEPAASEPMASEPAASEPVSWQLAPEPAVEPTPLPHLPMPRPRESDVDELLSRLDEVSIPVTEVGAGLRRLAGLELTPPPRNKPDRS